MSKRVYLKIGNKLFRSKPNADVGAIVDRFRAKGHKVTVFNRRPPAMRILERWSLDGIAQATDGCRVEPDGCCMHGHNSWLLEMGLI